MVVPHLSNDHILLFTTLLYNLVQHYFCKSDTWKVHWRWNITIMTHKNSHVIISTRRTCNNRGINASICTKWSDHSNKAHSSKYSANNWWIWSLVAMHCHQTESATKTTCQIPFFVLLSCALFHILLSTIYIIILYKSYDWNSIENWVQIFKV